MRYEREVERTPGPAVHGVHERRFVEVMAELKRLRTRRLPAALDAQVERERQARELERIARAMAESAGDIPSALPAGIDPDEARAFRALAAELERHSLALANDVALLTPEELGERVSEIDATCARCHSRFRIPLGPD